MKTKMTKYMANASFYRWKFGTIDWLTNYLVGGQPLIWWLVFDIVGCWLLILLAGQNIISNIRIRAHCTMKVIKILASLNHYTGRGQNLSVHTDLAWNEKRSSLFYPFTIPEIYHLQSHFKPNRIFFSKETLTRITPHTRGK